MTFGGEAQGLKNLEAFDDIGHSSLSGNYIAGHPPDDDLNVPFLKHNGVQVIDHLGGILERQLGKQGRSSVNASH